MSVCLATMHAHSMHNNNENKKWSLVQINFIVVVTMTATKIRDFLSK